jgi:aminoglycoside phosphotransferase (APT) family kinase protein
MEESRLAAARLVAPSGPGDPWARVPSDQITMDVEESVTGDPQTALASWLCSRLGRRLVRLTRRVGGGGGFKSTVYFAQTAEGSLVVRAPHRGTGWNARLIGCPDYHCVAGAYALGRLTALGQPVPELLALEPSPAVLGGPFAVFSRVAGVHLADYSEQWSVWPYPEEQWGEFLRACHSLQPVRGAGPVDDQGIGWSGSWSEYVSRLLLARTEEHADCLPPDFGARWRRLLERYAVLLDQRPVRLLQMESNGYCNLILDPVTHCIKAVIDFEEVTAGDPLFELVSMAWYLGRRGVSDHGEHTCFQWKRFSLGYGPVEWGHPLIPVYRTLMLLEKLWKPARHQRIRRLVRTLHQAEHPA